MKRVIVCIILSLFLIGGYGQTSGNEKVVKQKAKTELKHKKKKSKVVNDTTAVAKKVQEKKPAQKEETVIICNSPNAYAYHKYFCRGLNRCKHSTSEVTKSEAIRRGYRACKNCY